MLVWLVRVAICEVINMRHTQHLTSGDVTELLLYGELDLSLFLAFFLNSFPVPNSATNSCKYKNNNPRNHFDKGVISFKLPNVFLVVGVKSVGSCLGLGVVCGCGGGDAAIPVTVVVNLVCVLIVVGEMGIDTSVGLFIVVIVVTVIRVAIVVGLLVPVVKIS
jgi:hypothetical protein